MALRLLCLALIFMSVNAHTYLSSVTINGVKQTGCLRPLGTNSPISAVTSPDMTCGFLPKGMTPASTKCPIAAGSTISLQWNHNNDLPGDDIIDPSHKGPCLVYLSADNGQTWFKIFESGYDTSTMQFCVIDLINNKGVLTATIPSDIAPGNYILRGEIIALHEAFQLGGAQPYVDCVELTISGTGTATPAGVQFPGAYSNNDPGIYYNLYATPMAPYVIPGPKLYVSGSSSGSASGSAPGGSGSGSASGGNGGSGSGSASGNGGNNINTSSPESSSMSTGAKVALALFFIATVGLAVLALYLYRKNGHLFGYTLKKHTPESAPRGGNYVAFRDNL